MNTQPTEQVIFAAKGVLRMYWREMYRAGHVDLYEAIRRLFNCGCRDAELGL